MGRPGCAGRPGQRSRIRGVRHADHWLGRHVAGRRRGPVDRPVSHAVNRPRFRLRHAGAFMTLQEIGEVLGLRGVHADDHARLAHRLLVRVPHVTGQWVRRPPEPVERSPALPCLFQPRRGVTGTRGQLRITHRAIPPHERDAMPRPPTETGRPYVASARLNANQYVEYRCSAGMITDNYLINTYCNCRKAVVCLGLPWCAELDRPRQCASARRGAYATAGETRPEVALCPPGPTPLLVERLPPRARCTRQIAAPLAHGLGTRVRQTSL